MDISFLLLGSYVFLFGGVVVSVYALSSIVRNQYSSYEERTLQHGNKNVDGIYVLIDPDKLAHISLGVASVLFVVGFTLFSDEMAKAVGSAFLFGAVGYCAPRLYLRGQLEKRKVKVSEQLPEALDRLSSSMKAGLTLPQAIEKNMESLPKPIKEEFGIMFQEYRLGMGVIQSLKHWDERMKLQDISSLVVAVDISFRSGGNMTEVLTSTSLLIKERNLFAKEVLSLTSEGRAQAVIVAITPILMFLYSGYNDPEIFDFFLTTDLGKVLLATIVGMQLIAYFWISKIMDIDY